jgi:hypothetical protein
MTEAGKKPLGLQWRTDWDGALAEARATRRVVLIDVWKDP